MKIISGCLKGRSLLTLTDGSYRPAMGKVREALFSILISCTGGLQGKKVLDLFAGTGSLAFEALSRGASKAVCVEKNSKVVQLIKKNILRLNVEDAIQIFQEDVLHFLAHSPEEGYDLIFIDPPYILDILYAALDRIANNRWLSEDGIVCAEVRTPNHEDKRLLYPEGFNLIVKREYGQTTIMVLKYGE